MAGGVISGMGIERGGASGRVIGWILKTIGTGVGVGGEGATSGVWVSSMTWDSRIEMRLSIWVSRDETRSSIRDMRAGSRSRLEN